MSGEPIPAGGAAERASPAGLEVDASDPERLRQAIEAAFDYRGDVTIRTRAGESIAGYVYDRRAGPTLAGSVLRVIPADGGARVTLGYDQVASVAFTGRDTAAGRSFETWVRNYVRKKLAGESAGIEAEPLE